MSGRYIVGLLLVAIGIVYLLEATHILPWYTLSNWWPVILIVLGLNSLVRHPYRPWGALTVVLIGVVLLLWRLGFLSVNVWPLVLALLIIIIGLRLLIPHRRMWPIATAQNKDRLNESISFGSMRYQDNSPQFQGGRVSASFSSYELDLRGATLTPEGADLVLDTSFGSIEVHVPNDWIVVATGVPVFGSCINKTGRAAVTAAGEPVLRVKCSAQFGSVEITN